MNTWIMTLNLTRDDNRTFLDRVIEKGIGKNVELSKTDNVQNIKDGDLVYLRYGGSEDQSDNDAVRGLYAVLKKTGYKVSEQLTLFTIEHCYGMKVKTVNSKTIYSTLLAHDLIEYESRVDLKGKLMSTGKNSISSENSEKDREFVESFLKEIEEVKLKVMTKLRGF